MRMLRVANTTARFHHHCESCGIKIEPGTQYKRSTYFYDGRLCEWKSCLACELIVNDVYAWMSYQEEGVSEDDFCEWAECHRDDVKFGGAARAFLARVRDGAVTG